MIDRRHIGASGPERVIDVERGLLYLFCQAIGETNPIYLDPEAARKAGYPAIPAPPTYAQCLISLAPKVADLVLSMEGVDLKRMLHGEQAFTYHHPMFVGDQITFQQRIADIYDKKGGALEFVVLETVARNQKGERCVTMLTTAVIRN